MNKVEERDDGVAVASVYEENEWRNETLSITHVSNEETKYDVETARQGETETDLHECRGLDGHHALNHRLQ